MNNELTFEQSFLLDVLREHHIGKHNAVTSKQLKYYGWQPRDIRKIVHRLRILGYPICSSKYGYYYAETSDEVHRTLKFLESYLNNTKKAYDGLLDTYHEMRNEEILNEIFQDGE